MKTNSKSEKNRVCDIELSYKSKYKSPDRPYINSAKDAFDLFLKSWDQNTIELVEEFKVLFLNRANKVLAFYPMSTGGINGTVADPRLAFTAALKVGACSIITAHNH